MSHPLGSRFGRQKDGERRVVMKPAVESYLVNVRLPSFIVESVLHRVEDPSRTYNVGAATQLQQNREGAKGDYAEVAQNVTVVKIPTHSTANDAIACILKAVEYYERPVEEYMLAQCFADFSINFSLRGLFGASGPVRHVMEFPYYLSLVLNPYVAKQRRLMETDEPNQRAIIAGRQRAFHQMCQEYAEMLERLHSHYVFLTSREADARRTKKMQERRSYFDIAEVQLFREERAERETLSNSERDAWAVFHFSSSGLLEHQRQSEQLFHQHLLEAGRLRQTLDAALSDYLWVKMLEDRYASTIYSFETQLADGERYRRALYTDSRIQSTLRGAREHNVTPEQFHDQRVQTGRQRHPVLHTRPEAANSYTINRDVLSNTRVL